MEYALTLLPVLLLLLVLVLLDSFKLVPVPTLLLLFVAGCLAAAAAFFINNLSMSWLKPDPAIYSQYVAPLWEELLKAVPIFFLIRKKKIGLLIDAAICGFATGAGFAVVENIYYLVTTPDPDLTFWTIRGFGTAVMHSGSTALLATAATGLLNTGKRIPALALAGLPLAYLIHSAFNHFYLNPLFQTTLVILLVPAILVWIFRVNEKHLQKWLETEFFSEAELLLKMNIGEFSDSKPGKFLAMLKDRYPPATIIDMYCFISLYLEFSVKAKRNLLLAECGLPVVREPGITDKILEFNNLRKRIGKSGELALSPLLKLKQRDLWKLTRL